jgi:hypothetical protein
MLCRFAYFCTNRYLHRCASTAEGVESLRDDEVTHYGRGRICSRLISLNCLVAPLSSHAY